jgi:hypothetical protein
MGLLTSIKSALLRKSEAKLVAYHSSINHMLLSVNQVDKTYAMVKQVEGLQEALGGEEALSAKFNLDMLESIKRDLKIALKSCELMGQAIEDVNFDSLKWWDFKYLDRVAQREKNVISSIRSVNRQLCKFANKTTANFI